MAQAVTRLHHKRVLDMQAADTISDAEHIAEKQKKSGANQVHGMAQAVHGAADELGKQMPQAAELVHAAASRLEQAADALRERSIGEIMESFNDVGRKQPLALFGGAVAAGFAISRFLKSSSTNSH
jgi:ABC-type transporter Mla subunit MlaD